MYISNSSNIGMATLLHQNNNKNCMKTLTNGSNGGTAVAAGGVTSSGGTGGSLAAVGGTGAVTQIVGSTAAVGISSGTANNNNSNALLSNQTQAILVTNGATGVSSILSYQQYQQLLQQQQQQQQQQQHQQQQTRIIVSNEMVGLGQGGPNVGPTSNGGAVPTSNAQGTFLVAVTGSSATTSQQAVTSMAGGGFQQQFQQQLAALAANNQQQTTVVMHPQQQHQVATSVTPSSNSSGTVTRYFSQFSNVHQPQQHQLTTASSITTGNRPTHAVVINRSGNVIRSAGNATGQRLSQTATIISKQSPSTIHPQQTVLNAGKVNTAGSTGGNTIIIQQIPQKQPKRVVTQQQLQQQQQQQPRVQQIQQKSPATTTTSTRQINSFNQLQPLKQVPLTTPRAPSAALSSGAVASSLMNGSATPKNVQSPVASSMTLPNADKTPTSNGDVNETNQQPTGDIDSTKTAIAADGSSTAAAVEEEEPEIDIVINNVVCSFSVRCHLNLREIALNGVNVEYRRENGMVTMKLRRPYTTASIWSSGRITCTGATSEDQAKVAARRYARCLQKLGFRVRFHNFRVVNVLGTCSMPWAIKIVLFSEKYKKEASYEPELHPGVTYKLRYPKATLKIFSTGSVTVTAASVAHVQAAIEHIFPLVYEFRKKRSREEMEQLRQKQINNGLLVEVPPELVAATTDTKVVEDVADNDLENDDVVYAEDDEFGEGGAAAVAEDNVLHSPESLVDGPTADGIARAAKLHRKRPNPLLMKQNRKKRSKYAMNDAFDKLLAGGEDSDADDPLVVVTDVEDIDDLIEGPDDE